MARTVDTLTRALTGSMHRIHAGVPVLDRWPGTAHIFTQLAARVRLRTDWARAVRHRRLLADTTFIGVGGSVGKTSTKLMMAAVLRSRYRVSCREDSANFQHSAPRTLLMARPEDNFCVMEVSAGQGPGSTSATLDLVRPTIGVITAIGTDHYAAFGSREAIAEEKGRMIRRLPADGVAVLNADDPLVMGMRDRCPARVISYGLAAGADVRAESVTAIWPDRLSFELVHDGRRVSVRTRMCGTGFVSGALAAAAVGLAADIPLEEIARALAGVEPYKGRMSPLALPDGVTFVRDDWKASVHTIPPALEFLRAARAVRKVAIFGTLSDYSSSSRTQYVRTAKQALEASDTVIFVGPRASSALRARPADEPERLRAFATVRTASEFLATFLEAGDLVLLKGSNPADHLFRIALSRTSNVSCWRADCRKTRFCDTCEFVATGKPSAFRAPATPDPAAGCVDATVESLLRGETILVGLGNPGRKYANTPHNVGYAVLDRIAAETNASWSEDSRAVVAFVEWRGIGLSLVKPKSLMNHSGPVLHSLLEHSGVGPDGVVLVYDDNDLPLGKVRARMRGSDGGHRGVRSVLEAFQSDQFLRIKIGVKRAAKDERTREAVLRPFSDTEEPVIAAAMDTACSRLLEVLASNGR